MFNSYEFTFAGESSEMYGLMLYDFGDKGQSDVPFGNKASIVETRTNSRIQPIHFGVKYHETPLQFKLVFGSEHELDRYDMETISLWLTGHQDYQWLTIHQPDLEGVQFRCLITELTPLTHGWLPYAFEATVLCDCPYAYGLPFERQYTISDTTDILVRNESSVREFIKPTITFVPAVGTTTLSIINHDDGDREFRIDDIHSSSVIEANNLSGILLEKEYGYNLYRGFNLNFFRLVHGDNNLTVTGNGTLTISCRFLHNVAA